MTIIQGDCLEIMKSIENNSVDFIVTDPPYGLNFMGKDWDKKIPGIDIWSQCLRICKPGSMLAAFGGTRTHHHLMLALEQSGWEIRDVIMWLYGSGFPKSHNKFGLEGYGTALKPAWEPIILAMKPCDGTFAQNSEKWDLGGININSSRIQSNGEHKKGPQKGRNETFLSLSKGMYTQGREFTPKDSDLGRWPANLILDEEAGEMLNDQTGILKPPGNKKKSQGNQIYGSEFITNNIPGINCYPGEHGKGASRFFYCAKASSRERNEGLEKKGCNELQVKNYTSNFHPTVKPLSLMRYVIKLLAPPNTPILLDPFCGSGSTLIAAKELGIQYIGIELNPEYVEIAKRRIDGM